jgi:hypothetical protein
LVLIVRSLSRTWGWIAVTLVAVAAGLPSGIRTPGEWLLGYGCMLIAGTAAVIFCFCFARRNYLAYALVFLGMAVAPKIAELSDTGNPALAGHSGVIAGVLVLLAGWIVWPSLLRRG